jgi:multicomponent Na+:H+ antiporter subunit A
LSGSPSHGRGLYGLLALLPFGLFISFSTLLLPVAEGEFWAWSRPWVPQLHLDLSFHIDGLSLLMALIVSGVGTLIYLYASSYLADDRQINRFFVIITIFMLAMLGVVTADNIILLFIFWELTSISSYLLIGYKHEKEYAQRAALQALLVTGGGGLCLMAGLVLLGFAAESWQLSQIIQLGDKIQSSSLFIPILILVLLGAFTKSAQFPFHFWLPNAMAAPTPVSAYLHSATMVKAGVYLLARLHPALGHNDFWLISLVLIGGFTGLLGAWLGWQQVDLKRILAYTTISALGVLVFLLGLGSKYAIEAAMVFLLVHSLYKGALFMAAGSIEHSTGTRDVTQLGGLWRLLPTTFIGVLLAVASLAGIPPMLGFVGKELIYKSTVEASQWAGWLTTTAVLTNSLIVASGAIILFIPFFRKMPANSVAHQPHAVAWQMWLGPVLLGSIALLTGLFVGSDFVSEMLFSPAISSVAGEPLVVHLHLIPPVWDIVPLLSLLTLGLGLLGYVGHERLRNTAVALTKTTSTIGPENLYFTLLNGVISFAGKLTAVLQDGYLRHYVLFIALTFLGLIGGYSLLAGLGLHLLAFDIRSYEFVVGVTIIAATLFVMKTGSRLGAVIGLGVIGYSIAFFYLLFGAPDLAMTQFSIETLTVILFVLVLFRLPRFKQLSSRAMKLRDLLIATAVGMTMTFVVLTDLDIPRQTEIANYYAEQAYKLAHGRNVVNVILVDFRGLDTMVEITVLTVAALGVYALIKASKEVKSKK